MNTLISCITLSTALAIAAFPVDACADVPNPSAVERSLPVDAVRDSTGYTRVDVGFASAVGLVGVSVGWTASRYFELEGGVGFGFSGLQLSLMPKLTLGSERHRFVFGVGGSVSIGKELRLFSNEEDEKGSSGSGSVSVFPWVNVDVGYEVRWQTDGGTGLNFMVAVGTTGLLPYLPQARLGFGVLF